VRQDWRLSPDDRRDTRALDGGSQRLNRRAEVGPDDRSDMPRPGELVKGRDGSRKVECRPGVGED
jgi:hypothetical protein